MKVLIVEDDTNLGRLFSKVVAGAGHAIDLASDGRAALARLGETSYDVLLCDWLLPDVDGIEVIRTLRRMARVQPYVVLATGLVGAAARAHALSSGADAVLEKPVLPPALLRAIGGAAQHDRREPPSPVADIARTPQWASLRSTLAATLAGCVHEPFEIGDAPGSPTLASSVRMVDPRAAIGVGLALLAAREDAEALARRMVGTAEPDDALTAEVLDELCNNIAGAAKALLRQVGLTVAMGLPHARPCSAASDIVVERGVRDAFTLHAADGNLECVVSLAPASVELVPASRLTERMVLAEDVRTAAGALLLPSGTRLTGTTADRIAAQLPKALLRVCGV